MRIAVIGAGGWGTTLAILLSENSHQVCLWSFAESDATTMREKRENSAFLPGVPIPSAIDVTSDLLHAVEGCELVVCAVPSQYMRSVLVQLQGHPLGDVTIVNVSKGIENGTLMTMSEMILDVFPGLSAGNVVTLSGPSHAEEVSRKIPTLVVAASSSLERAKLVQSAFMVPYFRVYESNDIRGVEMGGSLKNVIAIAAGIIDGANLGDNTKAALMTRGIAEIARVGVALGAHVRTFRKKRPGHGRRAHPSAPSGQS